MSGPCRVEHTVRRAYYCKDTTPFFGLPIPAIPRRFRNQKIHRLKAGGYAAAPRKDCEAPPAKAGGFERGGEWQRRNRQIYPAEKVTVFSALQRRSHQIHLVVHRTACCRAPLRECESRCQVGAKQSGGKPPHYKNGGAAGRGVQRSSPPCAAAASFGWSKMAKWARSARARR